jgi:two-component system LytT family response regulator/two-component system response regulator LytT
MLIDPSDVTHAYVIDDVVCVCAAKLSGMTTHKTLEELENDLDPRVFWRVHRSYIVNINRIAEIIPLPTGSYRLRLDDEKKTTVPLSRAQAKKLRKVVKW